MFLVRKITRIKWDATRNAARGLTDKEVSADAVTADLRTQGGTLSFWQCSTEAVSDLEEAVLAIAAAGQRLDKIEVVWMAVDDLRNDGLILKGSNGRTPVADLADQHVDICHLDYVRLGKVARHVVESIEHGRHRHFSKKDVKELLLTANRRERINPSKLAGGLKKELGLDTHRHGCLELVRRAFMSLYSWIRGI